MKYIIEVEDIGHGLFRAKGFNTLVFDINGLNRLEPYFEKGDEVLPEFYWRIDSRGEVKKITDVSYDTYVLRKAIGNVFDTKAEAERAVAKLKGAVREKERIKEAWLAENGLCV